MYADRESDAMRTAISETVHRRAVQTAYNEAHNITPATVKKAVADILSRHIVEEKGAAQTSIAVLKSSYNVLIASDRKKLLAALNAEMLEHAKKLEFEQAAAIRDEIVKINEMGTMENI
jgi:excinuclease ABC subunit B